MRKIIFGSSLLFIVFIAAGCAGSQLHQSLLLHENRQLEDALFVAYAQVADLQRENEVLRRQRANESFEPPRQSRGNSWDDDWDLFPPMEIPPVILPDEPGTTDVPEWLIRGSQTMPTWSPTR